MRTECRVYVNVDKSFLIFPPTLVRAEQDKLLFVYRDTLTDHLKAWCTSVQLKACGSMVYQIVAKPHIDYRGDGLHAPINEVTSMNRGLMKGSVVLEKEYSRIEDEEWGQQP